MEWELRFRVVFLDWVNEAEGFDARLQVCLGVKFGDLVNRVGLTIGLECAQHPLPIVDAAPEFFPILGTRGAFEAEAAFLDFFDHN